MTTVTGKPERLHRRLSFTKPPRLTVEEFLTIGGARRYRQVDHPLWAQWLKDIGGQRRPDDSDNKFGHLG